jgi:hypothetical protein
VIVFVFTDEEREMAVREGKRRNQYARQFKSRGNNWAGHEGTLYLDTIGAAGEIAVASYLCLKHLLFADQRPVRASFDLPGIDVKTRSRHYYDLIVHANEKIEHKIFWLVTIEDKETRIHGWIPGDQCKRREWLRPDRIQPCYFVPQKVLCPPDTYSTQPLYGSP